MSIVACCRGEAGRSAGRLPVGTSKVRNGDGTVGIDGAGGSIRLEIGEAPERETGLGGVCETCEGKVA
jgi:hypothetical protein